VKARAKPNKQTNTRARWCRIVLLVILAISMVSCTPGQIEGAFNQLAIPFESGYDIQSVEGALFQAGLVLTYLVPGLGLGPGLF